MFLDTVLIWVAFYVLTIICLRLSYSSRLRNIGVVLILVVFAQLMLKLYDRYYLPYFSSRAGDETFWLTSLATYQTNGTIPVTTLAQGPGIFYASALTGQLLHLSFASALVVLAIGLGSLYVLPAFGMYSSFAKGSSIVAIVGVILVSMSDVMIYSTTIARPTLFGLFLLPLAMRDMKLLYEQPGVQVLFRLLAVTFLILLFHTPISYIVLLLTLSLLLILRKATWWTAMYTVLAFGIYGLFLRLALPDLYRIWRVELFGAYPLNILSGAFGNNFFVLFFCAGGFVVLVSLGVADLRGGKRWNVIRINETVAYMILAVALIGGAGLVLVKYSSYIALIYGSPVYFLLLNGWKIPFAILTLYGLRISLREKPRGVGLVVALSWLISVALAVGFLATYPPIGRFVGLWNLDERFAEFLYYPAFYFIAVGVTNLRTRMPKRLFDWVAIPSLALFVIPSIIVGTRDPTFFK
jgi:hypothetical protein